MAVSLRKRDTEKGRVVGIHTGSRIYDVHYNMSGEKESKTVYDGLSTGLLL